MKNSIAKILTLMIALFATQSLVAQTAMSKADKMAKTEQMNKTDMVHKADKMKKAEMMKKGDEMKKAEMMHKPDKMNKAEVMKKGGEMKKSAMSDKATKVIQLSQIPGEYETKNLNLKAGEYVFEITNKNVDHPVAFFLTTTADQETPVDNSLLKGGVNAGNSAKSGVVNLSPGTYLYSCPMNPTEKYNLTVTK